MTSPSEAVIEEEEKRLKMKCEKQEYVWDCDQQMKQAVHSTGRVTEGNGALPQRNVHRHRAWRETRA